MPRKWPIWRRIFGKLKFSEKYFLHNYLLNYLKKMPGQIHAAVKSARGAPTGTRQHWRHRPGSAALANARWSVCRWSPGPTAATSSWRCLFGSSREGRLSAHSSPLPSRPVNPLFSQLGRVARTLDQPKSCGTKNGTRILVRRSLS